MNIERGLFRAWLVGSAGWIAYWVWAKNIACDLGAYSAPWCTAFWQRDPLTIEEYAAVAAFIFGIPLATLVAGILVLWIVQGFRAWD